MTSIGLAFAVTNFDIFTREALRNISATTTENLTRFKGGQIMEKLRSKALRLPRTLADNLPARRIAPKNSQPFANEGELRSHTMRIFRT